jgi:hypothetical protein
MASIWRNGRDAASRFILAAGEHITAIAVVFTALGTVLGLVFGFYAGLRRVVQPLCPVLQSEFSAHILGFYEWEKRHDAALLSLESVRCELLQRASIVDREEQFRAANALSEKQKLLEEARSQPAAKEAHLIKAQEAQVSLLELQIKGSEALVRDANKAAATTHAALKTCPGMGADAIALGDGSPDLAVAAVVSDE